MSSPGIKQWISRVREEMGDRTFRYSDLPEELQLRREFSSAQKRGYIRRVDRVTRNGSANGARVNVWQVSDKLPRWSQ